jgi:DNA-binding MarR family transcriptional regulator
MTTLITDPPRPLRKQSGDSARMEPAFRSLIRTLGLVRRAMEPYFAQHGISASQWSVLRALHRAQEESTQMNGMRLRDLSDSLLVRPPSVTGAIDRLQRMGLVARRVSNKDQRAKLVSLTAAGRKLVDRVRQGHAQQVQRVLNVLNVHEQQELRRLLDRLGDHLEEMNGGAEDDKVTR